MKNMKDKNKYKKGSLTGFLRYRRDGMTGRERNAFERELQRDPFSEEAAEGFATISPDEASKDMLNLQKQLKTRTIHKKGYLYYSIAASVAVLMVITSVFLLITHNITEQPVEIATLSEPLEIIVSQPVKEPVHTEGKSEKKRSPSESISAKRSDIYADGKDKKLLAITDKEKSAGEISDLANTEKQINVTEKLFAMDQVTAAAPEIVKADALSEKMAKGKVISSEDNQPVPGATITVKGSKSGVMTDAQGYFNIRLYDTTGRTLVANSIGMESKEFEAKEDSQLLISLDPSVAALSEVVVVGYGVNRTDSEKQNITDYSPPRPVDGKSEFDKYIRENIHRPDTVTSGQRVVVVVTFIVRTDGRVDGIAIVRSPDKSYSDEAIRLIKSGPAWIPATERGKIIEDSVRVRIVFR